MSKRVAIIGGGPAGLMAAETISATGVGVTVYEAMPTVGRKFLMAGKSGLNLTHAEDMESFLGRFGEAKGYLQPALMGFDNTAVRDWAEGLGSETFIGSSGRVFPVSMKASPLLRNWLDRLARQGVAIKNRHRWGGFADGALAFDTPEGPVRETFDAVVLALGGASWPRLGSDAAWVPWLREKGVSVAPFRPANCGFVVNWSGFFLERFAGEPVKAVTVEGLPGEFVISRRGVEGSLVYAHSALLRDRLEKGETAMVVDLAPGRSVERLRTDLDRQPAKASFANRLRKGAGLGGVKAGLVRELTAERERLDNGALANAIKGLAIPLVAPRPIEEAISVAGGISWAEIGADFEIEKLPGVFAAGEMLDWEAPTGGYLLTACLATGRAAAKGVLGWLDRK